MKNQNFIHEFFYAKETAYARSNNIWYNNQVFYSYDTVIAQIVTGKDCAYYTLVSIDNMSSTTSKHISYLVRASNNPVIYVPFKFGSQDTNISTLLERFICELLFQDKDNFKLKKYRDKFLFIYENFKKFIEVFKLQVPENELDKIEKFADYAIEIEGKRSAALDKHIKKRIETAQKLFANIQGKNYLDKIKTIFTSKLLKHERNGIVSIITQHDKYTLIYPLGDGTLETSGGALIPENTVKSVLKLWKNNQLNIGYQVLYCVIQAITEEYIQIGYNCIPQQNIKELYNYYFGA